ncbi:MAG: hypothetical protein V4584_12720 [Verrucomicrobiota bacterium]
MISSRHEMTKQREKTACAAREAEDRDGNAAGEGEPAPVSRPEGLSME